VTAQQSDWRTLGAGRALDALVARAIGEPDDFHADPTVGPSHGDPGGYRLAPAPYSTDIAAAWRVVEAMARRGHPVVLSAVPGSPGGEGYCCATFRGGCQRAATAPLALCRAAAAAVEAGA